MRAPRGPVAEFALSAPREFAGPLDRALGDWLATQLAAPGVADARLLAPAAGSNDQRVERRILLFFEGDAAAADAGRGRADELAAAVPADWRAELRIEVRCLREQGDEAPAQPACANCEAPLYGQYCGACGQRARDRIISLWELLRDAAGDLFELDSRLWRTLIPLSTRPGMLTADYLRGRRARYMPPFRTYLVLSLLFFVASSLGGDGIGFVVDASDAPVATADGDRCADITVSGIDENSRLGQLLTEERLRHVCERIVGDGGKAFVRAMSDNVAVALYVLLPLMALVLKLLYPLSRRYYVEHLLFVVHVHAFFFLVLLAQLALEALAAVAGIELIGMLAVPLVLYALYYPYAGMRRVYRQGRLATLAKYLLLVLTYLVSFGLMMAAAALIAAFSL